MSESARTMSSSLATRTPAQRTESRRALMATSVGTFIEFYDFAIYGYTAATIATAFFPESDPLAALLSALAVYGIAFFMRPLGGIFFGRLGDRVGRKNVLMVVLLLVGLSTACVGFLPTFATSGYWAPVLLVIMRLIQGFSAGGEAVGAMTLAYEKAPVERRGMYATTVIAIGAVPAIFSALLVLAIESSMSADAFKSWGWRIVFWLALPLSAIAFYIRSRTSESEEFASAKKSVNGAGPSFGQILKHSGKNIVWLFLIAGASSLGYYLLVGYLVPYSQVVLEMDQSTALIANAIALSVYAIMLILAGLLGDLYGRKRVMLIGAVSTGVLAIPAFMLVGSGSLIGAILGQVLLSITVPLIGAATYPYAIELFPTLGRYTAGAIGYNLGFAVFGGSAPYVSQAIVNATGFKLTPAFLVVAVALVLIVCGKWIPARREIVAMPTHHEPAAGTVRPAN